MTSSADISTDNQALQPIFPVKPSSLIGPLLLAAFFFAFIGWLNYPEPMADDLFYTGPALNMATGGDFSNPLLARQNFPSHYFFVYPPFHAYAVYGWISVFGISAASLLAFQNLMFFVIAGSTMLILRYLRAPQIFCYATPLAITAVFLTAGLRPEAFAVAATLVGYALVLYKGENLLCAGVSFGLFFLGAAAAPRNGIFVGMFLIVLALDFLKTRTASRNLQLAVAAGAAFLVICAAFSVMIHFRFHEFLQTFRLHASRLSGSKLFLMEFFLRETGTRCLPLFLLAGILVIASLRRPAIQVRRLCQALTLAFVGAAMTGGLSFGGGWYPLLIALLLGADFCQSQKWLPPAVAPLAIAGLLLLANISFIVEVIGLLSGRVVSSPPENAPEICSLRSTAEHPVLISEAVGRYVFDYKIPSNYILYEFAAPFPGFSAIDAPLRPEDVYVVSPGSLLLMNSRLNTSFYVEYWNPLGIAKLSTFKYPHQAYVLTANEILVRKLHQ